MSKVRGRSNEAITTKDANKVMTTAIAIFRACLFFIFPPPLPKTKRLQTFSNSELEYKFATLIYLSANLNLTLIWDGETP